MVDPVTIGQRLREARRRRRMTQEETARSLGASRTTMVAIEQGQRRLQPEELVRLARLYGISVHELLRPEVAHQDLVARFRLSLERAPDPETLERTIVEFRDLIEDYLQLERVLGMPLPRAYPTPYEIRGLDLAEAAEDLAVRERNRLALGDGPLLSLRELLEADVGLRIFVLELPSNVDAIFSHAEAVGGCVGLSARHPLERQRMSLAHEYGHFLTRRDEARVTIASSYRRLPAEERWARLFAAAFLMPATGLRRRFSDLARSRAATPSPADLLRLSHAYQVSFQALVLRLEDLKLLPSGSYDRLIAAGFKVREAERVLGLEAHPSDTERFPLRYRFMAAEAYVKEKITEAQLAHFLRVDRITARRLVSKLAEAFPEVAREARA
ncbi:MAG TPA: XRE family transcriptional regulator [Chloroflexota bacterium]|nr:XRE family transcriptional regulator [Chloroflexota bacterium]